MSLVSGVIQEKYVNAVHLTWLIQLRSINTLYSTSHKGENRNLPLFEQPIYTPPPLTHQSHNSNQVFFLFHYSSLAIPSLTTQITKNGYLWHQQHQHQLLKHQHKGSHTLGRHLRRCICLLPPRIRTIFGTRPGFLGFQRPSLPPLQSAHYCSWRIRRLLT